MKYSDFFSSMDEVRGYGEWFSRRFGKEEGERMNYLLGLMDNQGLSDDVAIDGKTVRIDRNLASLIVKLNNAGIKTLACCSGLPSEHKSAKYTPVTGYLALEYSDDMFQYLRSALANYIDNGGLMVEDGECYLKRCVMITLRSCKEDVLKDLWVEIAVVLFARESS